MAIIWGDFLQQVGLKTWTLLSYTKF